MLNWYTRYLERVDYKVQDDLILQRTKSCNLRQKNGLAQIHFLAQVFLGAQKNRTLHYSLLALRYISLDIFSLLDISYLLSHPDLVCLAIRLGLCHDIAGIVPLK